MKKGSNDKLVCYREVLRKIVVNIEDLKLDIEKGKLEVEESIENVKVWGVIIE